MNLLGRALREHNNDVELALASLTSKAASRGGPGTEESIAVLESLGVPQDTARDVLRRAGNLRDALKELGISAPEGVKAGPSARGSSNKGSGSRELGTATSKEDGNADANLSEMEESEEEQGEGVPAAPAPTAEEMRLYEELVEDREIQGEEGHLDVTLEDEADAADM